MESTKKIKKGQIEDFISDATQTALDLKLSNDTTDYTDATTPLAGTEIALVDQGGTFKKVAVSEFGGGVAFPSDGKTYGVKDGVAVDINEYPILYWYQATGLVLETNGTNPPQALGTQSNIFLNGLSYRKYLTSTALGNVTSFRESAFGRILPTFGYNYENRFFLQTSTAPDWRGLLGFRVPSIPQNVNPTDDVQPFLGIGADGTDTNLFFISKPTLFGTISKVDTGIAKDTTDVLLLQMYRLKNTTTNFLKLTNLTTNSVVQTTFESTGFVTITNYISNNNSPQAIGYAIQRIKLKITD